MGNPREPRVYNVWLESRPTASNKYTKGELSMSIDYDDIECDRCGHVGVLPDGGFDWECPACGFEGSLLNEEDEDEDY